jgi:hypothetical protein
LWQAPNQPVTLDVHPYCITSHTHWKNNLCVI